jgi:hypothetical protein
MIRLPVLTVKRIIEGMTDADDRRALAQGFTALILLIFALICFAAAAGLAWNVFEFMRRL